METACREGIPCLVLLGEKNCFFRKMFEIEWNRSCLVVI